MPAHGRRAASWWLVGTLGVALAGASLVCTGCDPGALFYFLSPESLDPALMKDLGSKDSKKVNKILIMSWSALETRLEFVHADRELCEQFAKQLQARCEESDEKITIVPPRKVEAFKNKHEDWKRMGPAEVGRQFGADYVIYIEVHSLSLYEKSSIQLFRGRAELSLNLIDVKQPDDTPENQFITHVFPSEAHGPIPADMDTNPVQFRQQFLASLAKKLSQYFALHHKHEESVQE